MLALKVQCKYWGSYASTEGREKEKLPCNSKVARIENSIFVEKYTRRKKLNFLIFWNLKFSVNLHLIWLPCINRCFRTKPLIQRSSKVSKLLKCEWPKILRKKYFVTNSWKMPVIERENTGEKDLKWSYRVETLVTFLHAKHSVSRNCL